MARILIIDDDDLVSEILTDDLKSKGHDVTWADTGEKGLKACTLIRTDLIILDSVMPGLSGAQVLKRLQNDLKTRDIPVLMLTAIADRNAVVNALNDGATDYLTKPFSPEELAARAESILKRKGVMTLLSEDAE